MENLFSIGVGIIIGMWLYEKAASVRLKKLLELRNKEIPPEFILCMIEAWAD